ncbi:cyclic GMP-AMP synthase-like receptor [Eupeodes corollae]|uniref:cyclic GMP-AMP synthase-like receptor n=1 Tax=Eupeodes corollae TaxID=290404 RepID=UPI0024903FF4|nr:cyclic GMP-AMP synthase-like receptor [Eupeodes corollae]
MDEFYHSISKAINIDKNREDYTRIYDFVRINIIKGLKENEIFKLIFADLSLCGSYADNLKITQPDEFDLVVRLRFPFHESIDLIEDTVQLGNVYIDLTNVIDLVEKGSTMLKFLKLITNCNGYLLQDKFQSWFEGILTKYLNKIKYKMIHEMKQIKLVYNKQGPAHTIKVYSSKCEISIDFVPGFRFDKLQSISPRSYLIDYDDKWEAIPKPIGGPCNPSFRCSYTQSERRLLIGRNQFKNALRMMKKFRDMNPALVNLKSYFIKTLFLWHNNTVEQTYWNNSNHSIMEEMFEVLERALENRKIPFFWDENVNLLELKASHHQINCMYHHVRNARKIMSKRSSPEDLQNIKNLFLTRKEQEQISRKLEVEIQRSFWDVATEAAQAVDSYLPWCLGIAAGAFILSSFLNRQNN